MNWTARRRLRRGTFIPSRRNLRRNLRRQAPPIPFIASATYVRTDVCPRSQLNGATKRACRLNFIGRCTASAIASISPASTAHRGQALAVCGMPRPHQHAEERRCSSDAGEVRPRRFPEQLMNPLTRKTISSVPELANRTPFTFVVDSLLVRTTDYCVGHRDRKHSMLLHKLQYLPGDYGVGTNVTAVHFPVAQLLHLCILGRHDANSDLRRLAQVRTIERNRRNRPPPQAFSGPLTQALKEPIFHHDIASRAIGSVTTGLCDPLGYMELTRHRTQFPELRYSPNRTAWSGLATAGSLILTGYCRLRRHNARSIVENQCRDGLSGAANDRLSWRRAICGDPVRG
jgi:hypothetical protein